MLSACASNPAAPLIPPMIPPPPARCLVLCPPMPQTAPDPLTTAQDLQDWGSDCRERQRQCLDWAKDRRSPP
jgi:hypothetical protein